MPGGAAAFEVVWAVIEVVLNSTDLPAAAIGTERVVVPIVPELAAIGNSLAEADYSSRWKLQTAVPIVPVLGPLP